MVKVYSKNNCIQCEMTKKYLKKANIEFTEFNISTNEDYVNELKTLGFKSVPVVMTNDAELATIVGFQPDKLKTLA